MNYLDVYTRVSQKQQAVEGNSLVVQKETGQKIAKKLSEYTFSSAFTELLSLD